MHRSRYALILPCVLAISTAAGARAQPAPAPSTDVQTDKARELHLEADALYRKGEFAKARASYLAAWALKKHWQIAGSLADCEVKLGLFRDAAEHFAYYFRNLPVGRTPPPSAKKLYDDAKAKVATIIVQVNEGGADVKVDGVLVGTSPLQDPVFVAPGKHQVEARLGSKRASATFTADAGKPANLPLELKEETGAPAVTATAVPSASATTTASAAPSVTATVVPTAPTRSNVPAYALGAVGLASLIAGGVLVGAYENAKAEIRTGMPRDAQGDPLCQRPPVTGPERPECPSLRTKNDQATTMGNAGFALFGVGGVAIAGAVAYFFLWPHPSTAAARGASRLVPVTGRDGVGLMWIGSF
jgi:hypothetical protein